VDSEAQLAWRQGWLNYYKATLADVVRTWALLPGTDCVAQR
jgi:transmembrane sensor